MLGRMFVLSLFLAAAPPSSTTAKSIVEAELRDVLRQCRLVTVRPDAPTTDEERSGAEECRRFRMASRREKCEDKSARQARRVWEGRMEKLLDDKYLHKHTDNLTELPQHTRSSALATGIYSCSGEQDKQTCSRRAEFPTAPNALFLGFRDDASNDDSSYELTMDCTRFISTALGASGNVGFGSIVNFSASTALRSEASSRQGISVRAGVFTNVVYLPFKSEARREDFPAWIALARLYADDKLKPDQTYHMIDEWTGLVLHRNSMYGWNDDASVETNLKANVNYQFARIGADGSVRGTRGALSGLKSATATFYQKADPDWKRLPTPKEIVARWNDFAHDTRPVNGDGAELTEGKSVVALVHFGPVDSCKNVIVTPTKELLADKTIEFRTHRDSAPIAGNMCALQVEFAMRDSPEESDDGVKKSVGFVATVKGTELSTTYNVELRPQITTAPVASNASFAFDPKTGWRISFGLRNQEPFEIRKLVAEKLSCRSGASDLREALTIIAGGAPGQRDRQEIVVRLAESGRRFRELNCLLSMPIEIKRAGRSVTSTLFATIELPQDTSTDTVLVDASRADLKSLIRPDAETTKGIKFKDWLDLQKEVGTRAEENAAIREALGVKVKAADYAFVLEIPRTALDSTVH